MKFNINDLRNHAHRMAVMNGWHEKQWDDAHLLMSVIVEVAGAVQADSFGKRGEMGTYEKYVSLLTDMKSNDASRIAMSKMIYRIHLSGSLEDKLADVVIRMLDFAYVRDLDLSFISKPLNECKEMVKGKKLTEVMFDICKNLTGNFGTPQVCIGYAIARILCWCRKEDIDLEWFIEKKMWYNEVGSNAMEGKSLIDKEWR